MPTWPDAQQLRRCALGVAVLHDIDVMPSPHGVVLPGSPDVTISWAECRRAIAGEEPESSAGRQRLKRWLELRRWIADRPIEDLAERARPYGACVESPLHPGLDWVRRRVLGDALDLGFGLVGIDPDQPDLVVPIPHQLMQAAGIEPSPWWPTAIVYLERMGEMAAERIDRTPLAPLRPMGDCDVVTLLGSRTLRQAIVAEIPDGMRTVAVPMRTRGWLDLNRIDPAFSAAAARLTEVADRGFDRPLLVTREEVALAREDGDVIRAGIEDRLAKVIDIRDVLYHRN
ncbi:MAG TPA: hypothetical protein VHV79_01580 [Mycobacteriales bacterium]|jgi:hypothetical protein|nr:hypothetical protein [Mycobacteriales bacterium]